MSFGKYGRSGARAAARAKGGGGRCGEKGGVLVCGKDCFRTALKLLPLLFLSFHLHLCNPSRKRQKIPLPLFRLLPPAHPPQTVRSPRVQRHLRLTHHRSRRNQHQQYPPTLFPTTRNQPKPRRKLPSRSLLHHTLTNPNLTTSTRQPTVSPLTANRQQRRRKPVATVQNL